MAGRTIAIDDEVLKRAHRRAAEQGTSAHWVVCDGLEQDAGSRSVQEQALDRLLSLSGSVQSRRGQRTWTRDELHER
jgi:hypothetical protein